VFFSRLTRFVVKAQRCLSAPAPLWLKISLLLLIILYFLIISIRKKVKQLQATMKSSPVKDQHFVTQMPSSRRPLGLNS
jgi:hypothetical protein